MKKLQSDDWRLPNDCLLTSWQLPKDWFENNCLTSFIYFSLKVPRWLHDYKITTRLPSAIRSLKMVGTIKNSQLNFMCTHGVMLLARFATSILIPYVLDVLWCQPIKRIQVVSTSEYHEYWWKDVDFIFFRPIHLLQGLRSENKK